MMRFYDADLQAEHAALTVALADAVTNAEIQMQGGIPDPEIAGLVLDLCERHGYGNVMATASALWRKKDPVGAHACGPCFGSVEYFLKLAKRPLLKTSLRQAMKNTEGVRDKLAESESGPNCKYCGRDLTYCNCGATGPCG